MATIRRGEELSEGVRAPQGRFRGSAQQRMLQESAGPQTVRVSIVSFEAGAANYWHSHTGGQVLHVLSGSGRHQLQGEALETLAAGDTVSVEPGRRHFHGAARDAGMAHLAISLGDTEWTEEPPPE